MIRDEDSDVGIDLAAQTAWVGGVVFGFVCGFECGQQGKEGTGVGCSLRDDVTWCLLVNMLMHACHNNGNLSVLATVANNSACWLSTL